MLRIRKNAGNQSTSDDVIKNSNGLIVDARKMIEEKKIPIVPFTFTGYGTVANTMLHDLPLTLKAEINSKIISKHETILGNLDYRDFYSCNYNEKDEIFYYITNYIFRESIMNLLNGLSVSRLRSLTSILGIDQALVTASCQFDTNDNIRKQFSIFDQIYNYVRFALDDYVKFDSKNFKNEYNNESMDAKATIASYNIGICIISYLSNIIDNSINKFVAYSYDNEKFVDKVSEIIPQLAEINKLYPESGCPNMMISIKHTYADFLSNFLFSTIGPGISNIIMNAINTNFDLYAMYYNLNKLYIKEEEKMRKYKPNESIDPIDYEDF